MNEGRTCRNCKHWKFHHVRGFGKYGTCAINPGRYPVTHRLAQELCPEWEPKEADKPMKTATMTRVDCYECGGSGTVEYEWVSGDHTTRFQCPACKGSGRVWKIQEADTKHKKVASDNADARGEKGSWHVPLTEVGEADDE